MIWINLNKKKRWRRDCLPNALAIIDSLTIFSSPWKTVGGAKDKIMSPSKTNTIKDHNKPTRIKNVYGGGKKPTN